MNSVRDLPSSIARPLPRQGDDPTILDRLLKRIGVIDQRAAVAVAVACARAVAHLVPGDERPLVALQTAERWLQGAADLAECRRARRERIRVFHATFDDAPAREAARACFRCAFPEVQRAAADAAASARRALAAAGEPADLRAVVEGVTVAPTVPTFAQLWAGQAGAQVALDWLGDAPEALTVLELVEAHERAGRLGLDWSDPVERAVAERSAGREREVAALLGAVAGRVAA